MKTDNFTIANEQGAEYSSKENEFELESLADFHCDRMDDLCRWLDDENVNWKEKVNQILEECKKVDGLKLISNETIFIPIKDLFDVKSICDECDYYDYETDAVMNSFCVQRLRFDYSPSSRRHDTFSAVIYILEDGRFFIHHNYKEKEVLDNSIGWEFSSDYITNNYSDMLQFLLFSKEAIEEISSGNDYIRKFAHNDDRQPYARCVIVHDNEIHFFDQNIELKFTRAPKIDYLIELADAIYKMKERYERENNSQNS